MIFNLFKSKKSWQHKDSNVRIGAINDELTNNNSEDKAVLLSLLHDDDSELVRRAVLLKLNSLEHYLNESVVNNNKNVRAFAKAQVQDILSGKHNIILSTKEKQDFLSKVIESTKTNQELGVDSSVLNQWLDHENEPCLVVSLFEILVHNKNTAQFLLQTFTKKQSAEIQKHLMSLELNELNDVSLLTKLSKKAINDEVVQVINTRLSQLIEEKEKPIRVLKQKQLILSKLLALKDQSDYAHYLTNKSVLVEAWEQDNSDITCLPKEEQEILLNKFNKIMGQLTQIFAPKEEAYQQAKIAEKLLNEKNSAKERFNKTIAQLNEKITAAVFDGSLEGATSDKQGDNNTEEKFLTTLDTLNDNITASVLNNKEQNEFLQKSEQLRVRLTQLPEIAQSVSEATYLISNISQLTLPESLNELNERQQTYNDWLSNYKAVNKKAHGVLPQSITESYKEITQSWQNGLRPLQQEQKKLFEQTKKKLIDLKRLLLGGKYKVCFGLFKGVNQAITLLSIQQQQQLQRDFDNVSKRMAEISDWEHYIATPRKQELLVEINALVTTPLDDPNAQANKVKQYRKTWNSLGHADEDIDKELNEQFNLACEQAFAPCRLFYAEQEKMRAQHLVTRNEIITQAQDLAEMLQPENTDSTTVDFKAIDGKLNKLQQRWQQAGEVDREQYQKLFKQFKNIIQPIKNAIKAFHDANSNKKQALIVEAEQQLANEDTYQAIENVKKLQAQWREISFAGAHQESKLWQKFRAINDQVFAKRDQAKSEQKSELAQVAEAFNKTLIDIKVSLNDVADDSKENSIEKNTIINAKTQAEELLSQVIANKPVIKSVASEIEVFIKQLNKKIEHIIAEEEKESWQSLFIMLEKVAKSEIMAENLISLPEYQALTSFWQKRLSDLCLTTEQADPNERAEKTLELEILAQVESPDELASQRMAVQVKLIQEQMQSSGIIDLNKRLIDWLALGKLNASDVELLIRLKKVFV